ncbi:tannase and feruloyl esterase [Annulohypoxylon truncatum]|uniref:tannase and feruloyl esterase n=1 Tax=Annulohypoxylon truncatum TaxID=327061 RepID=UPI0020083431|nr:tannase and feruloyl esterase [Annulohypoxylon truncatum]KAI1206865.1 tannase and feruloyl esterase [Annulohypoxylon truncatum]
MYRLSALPFVVLAGLLKSVVADCTTEAFAAILKDNSNATINLVQAIPQNGSFGQGALDLPFPTNATKLPALCAVAINVKSSENSSYDFGLFLPDKTWNGRFLTTGNGGFGGGINWPDMGIFSQYGFATMSTDTGHNSSVDDGSWGLNAPESLIDWGHRAMHGSIVLAKEIITAYYASPDGIKYSYYAGCSTGGRQGLKEAQLYPDSFDGISVGAPAWWTVHLAANTLRLGLSNRPDTAPGHIDPSIFTSVIVPEITKQCDPQDGLVDGIINEPYSCNFNYEALLCTPTSNQTACLTPAQLDTLFKFYNPWIDANQTYVFPSMAMGADPTFSLGDDLTGLGYGLFSWWIYNNSDWDYTKFTYDDVVFADSINPGGATADHFDLSASLDHGTKIMMYHGGADALIPTGSSVYFYDQVTQALIPKGINPDDFYRFFLIPGMNHCSASDNAPWYIASASQTIDGATHSVPGYEDAEHDIILSMMKWVEEGEAPEQLIATKFVNDSAPLGVERQRPLCPYPKQSKYIAGDPNEPTSWECASLY